MSRAYTGQGDKGETSLWGGKKVPKNHKLINTLGEIDEANAAIGHAASFINDDTLKEIIKYLQNALFTAGSEIAAAETKAPHKITEENIKKIEIFIEHLDKELPQLNAFILPSGSPGVTALHYARTVIRRAERATINAELNNPCLIKFLNRASSLLFIMARWLKQKEGIKETNPKYDN